MVESIRQDYFVFDLTKYVFYSGALLYVVVACIVINFQPFIYEPGKDCEYETAEQHLQFHNPQYVYNPCRFDRKPELAMMTVEECCFGRRLVWATIFGSIIGWERRNADRPAGVRTMSLVALGSCLFSICSAFAFVEGPMNWDASRVSAAIPSGVGFLGSALIFKHTTSSDNCGGDGWHEVHGLTTAASVWLSAAVGIACAGGLYFVASLSTAIVLVMLRFGPRTSFQITSDGDDDDDDDGVESDVGSEAADNISVSSLGRSYQKLPSVPDPEMQSIIPPIRQSSSRKQLLKKEKSIREMRPSLM